MTPGPGRQRASGSLPVADLRLLICAIGLRVCVYYCSMCVFYYCRTYYKAVRVGGGGEWRTCAMRDDEPRPVWMSLPITHWFLVWESNPKLQGGWCKPNHQPIGGSDPNHQGIWSPPRAGGTREEPGTLIQGAPVFPGSSRLGIEPKTPGWLVQAQPPAHRGI
jgi:hypothetical protein